jgi:hypothetical protein
MARLPLFGCLLLVLISLGACSKEERNDYCKNHYLFHADHQDTLGHLEMKLNADGLMQSSLSIPASIFPGDEALVKERMDTIALMLQQGQVLYNLQTERDCQSTLVSIDQGSESLNAEYEAQCGKNNRLKQVDVTLLDVVAELGEIEVIITTAATSKRFAISRQCPSAIFRLDKRAKD